MSRDAPEKELQEEKEEENEEEDVEAPSLGKM